MDGSKGSWVFEGVAYADRGRMCRARRAAYVQALGSGLNFTQAARLVGVGKRTGKVWRNGRTRASGRDEPPSVDWYRGPMEEAREVNGRYLCQRERLDLADLAARGLGVRAMARALGRSPSTVSRELRRNAHPADGLYRPYRAGQLAARRRKRPKTAKIVAHPCLLAVVREKLAAHWSPEQISGWLRREYPDNKGMNACHETIYQAIYIQAKGQLRLDLKQALRKGRARRRPRTAGQERRARFREPMVMISERPAQVEDRAVPGHWEGDLIMGAGNKSAIGTLVERSTRFTILLHLPHGHDAGQVQDAIISQMQDLPALLRNTLTWDQGSEMALHRKIGTALDMQVFFCDPHSPWQRGTNENTNGLLRQYFPKGSDLAGYSQAYLDAVAEELNDRPRKTLDYMKPSEKIVELLNTSD